MDFDPDPRRVVHSRQRVTALDIVGYVLLALGTATFFFFLVGCASPEPIRAAEDASAKSLSTYVHNANELVRQAVAQWKREAVAAAEYKWTVAMERATDATTGAIPRETVVAAKKELDRIAGEIAVEEARAMTALATISLDLQDSLAFRGEIRRWLEGGGVGPEAAAQLADMIAGRLAK